VNNSSHNSTPIQVSRVLTTASPNGILIWKTMKRTLIESERGIYLLGHCLYHSRKEVFLCLTMLRPGLEISQLAVIPVVGEPHLGSDDIVVHNRLVCVMGPETFLRISSILTFPHRTPRPRRRESWQGLPRSAVRHRLLEISLVAMELCRWTVPSRK